MKLTPRPFSLYTFVLPVLASAAAALEHPDDAETLLHTLGINFPRAAGAERTRSLRHTVPPMLTPDGCTYKDNHDWKKKLLTDEIFCPNFCVNGVHFTLSVNTLLDDDFEPVVTYADCRVPKCNHCGNEINECPCPQITELDEACRMVCEKPESDEKNETEFDEVDETKSDEESETELDEDDAQEFDEDESKQLEASTSAPTVAPTTSRPSMSPVSTPSDVPSSMPSDVPSSVPSDMPSMVPSDIPSMMPSDMPSRMPSDMPSQVPSDAPSSTPSLILAATEA